VFNLLLINSTIGISGNRCSFFNCLVEGFKMFLIRSFNQTVKETTTITRNADGTVDKQQIKHLSTFFCYLLLINSTIGISGNRCSFFNCLVEGFKMFLISVNTTKQLKKLQRLPEMPMVLLISNKLNTYPLSFVRGKVDRCLICCLSTVPSAFLVIVVVSLTVWLKDLR
jgi:hypothetical protein